MKGLDAERLKHARSEIKLTGFNIDSKDVVYDEVGQIHEHATFALELLKIALKRDWDISSLNIVIDWLKGFNNLELLSDITDNPKEWQSITNCKGKHLYYQNLRNPSCFSDDLKTYRNTTTNEIKKVSKYIKFRRSK